jgi:hypothetical protein
LQPWKDRNSGVNWYLNQSNYDSKANYTQIRYELLNEGISEAGEKSSWVLWVYAFPNCEQTEKGVDIHDYPWHEVDCQTEVGGECQEVSYPIKSFAILNSDRQGECKTWSQLGSAATSSGRLSKSVYVMAIAVTFVIL